MKWWNKKREREKSVGFYPQEKKIRKNTQEEYNCVDKDKKCIQKS